MTLRTSVCPPPMVVCPPPMVACPPPMVVEYIFDCQLPIFINVYVMFQAGRWKKSFIWR